MHPILVWKGETIRGYEGIMCAVMGVESQKEAAEFVSLCSKACRIDEGTCIQNLLWQAHYWSHDHVEQVRTYFFPLVPKQAAKKASSAGQSPRLRQPTKPSPRTLFYILAIWAAFLFIVSIMGGEGVHP